MNLAAKITTAAAALVIVGLSALAAPAIVTTWTAAAPYVEGVSDLAKMIEPPAEPTAEPVDPAELPLDQRPLVYLGDGVSVPVGFGPGDCTTTAMINVSTRELLGEMVDMGAKPGASGSVVTDADGIRAYVVASGDSLWAIGERFCIAYPTVAGYNHVRGDALEIGQELILRPDPRIPWVDPYVPYAAEPGTSTIAYYNAIDEMSRAVAARDLDAARSVWDRLAADVSPVAATVAAQALGEGDWTVLRQMFP